MALCLPRKRRATSLATRPRTLSVASITNHSCVTSAGLALNVLVMSFLFEEGLAGPFPRSAFLWRESLRWFHSFAAGPQKRCEALHYTKNRSPEAIRRRFRGPAVTIGVMFSYRHAFHAGN